MVDVDEWPYDDDDDDDQLLVPAFGVVDDVTTPQAAWKLFRKENLKEDAPLQRVFISRMDGVDELRREIMGVYKNPNTNLSAGLKVRFEEEDAVGCGPVREFLSIGVKIIEDGISSSGSKRVLFFEGEMDHRLPVHNQSLRSTGTFKALGRMLGHSILHGGPGLNGVSEAMKSYIASDNDRRDPQALHVPITLKDVPDIELREMIEEVKMVSFKIIMYIDCIMYLVHIHTVFSIY